LTASAPPAYDESVFDDEEMDLSELDWDWRLAFGLADEERGGVGTNGRMVGGVSGCRARVSAPLAGRPLNFAVRQP
jgi:hypothetical protein